MFHRRYVSNEINRLHERALQIVYNNYGSSFEHLLIKDNSFCVHHQHIQRLMIEIYGKLNNMTNVYNDFLSEVVMILAFDLNKIL